MIPARAAAAKNTKNATAVKNKRILSSLLSGLLLTLSYPNPGIGVLGWVALVPLIMAVFACEKRSQALRCGAITGLSFFGTSLLWMHYVHFLAWFFLIPIEAFFVMLFALLVFEGRAISSALIRHLWIALAWTATEWLRAEIPIFGMGWNLLAYTQSEYLPVIQFANLFGAFGLGFVMALVNALAFQIVSECGFRLGQGKWKLVMFKMLPFSVVRPILFCGLAILTIIPAILIYGSVQTGSQEPSGRQLRFSVIQPNIPQAVKWDPRAKDEIIRILQKLTELASYDQPDLMVWPEASFPGYVNRDPDAVLVRSLVRRLDVPLLLGAPHLRDDHEAYNSSYLMATDGNFIKRYDKQYLVPFGEYVPLQPVLGFLNPIAKSLGISDFLSGTEATVFRLPGSGFPFSALICFEDTFLNVSRRFVKNGAALLVVMTNDAWFGASAAPFQHLQPSIFRAVENGVPLIRSANTGISAFISKEGRLLGQVRDAAGSPIFVPGYQTMALDVEPKPTFFKRGGWMFPYVATGIFLILFLLVKTRFRGQVTSKGW